MKPLLLYLNIAGPIHNKELDKMVHQIEMGVTLKGSKKPDAVRMAVPVSNTCDALDAIIPSVKAYIAKYYPQPK